MAFDFTTASDNTAATKFEQVPHSLGLNQSSDQTTWKQAMENQGRYNTAQDHLPNVQMFDSNTQKSGADNQTTTDNQKTSDRSLVAQSPSDSAPIDGAVTSTKSEKEVAAAKIKDIKNKCPDTGYNKTSDGDHGSNVYYKDKDGIPMVNHYNSAGQLDRTQAVVQLPNGAEALVTVNRNPGTGKPTSYTMTFQDTKGNSYEYPGTGRGADPNTLIDNLRKAQQHYNQSGSGSQPS